MATPSLPPALRDRLVPLEDRLHGWLVRYSIPALRVTVGAVFLGFGVLKFFPGVSPAERLVTDTLALLTFGLVPEDLGRIGIAALETVIGLSLLAGRWMRLAVGLLAAELIGVLAPLLLLPGRLFDGGIPTLEGQYVLKDIVLVAAAMVIAADSFRGGRLTRDGPDEP